MASFCCRYSPHNMQSGCKFQARTSLDSYILGTTEYGCIASTSKITSVRIVRGSNAIHGETKKRSLSRRHAH